MLEPVEWRLSLAGSFLLGNWVGSFQLSVISYQLSVISYQLSVTTTGRRWLKIRKILIFIKGRVDS
ncbi:MAG: hypothetical protein EWV80_09945 [Microcystis aeruginosa Ma_QC_B_20070730_S2]|uniref:Uncharacterized protein n=1 Tax=Microcystis aeruginosa Ma_QC_B_20070730_S2 TaxID=2486256 RepID=A0A552DSW5_MICAE|nr:MAG: hypothetical protein EWV80_09945 [Microcystis aeruginosa Ma_QC_B_20070730_S2]